MEPIPGRKATDTTHPKKRMNLAIWFQRMHLILELSCLMNAPLSLGGVNCFPTKDQLHEYHSKAKNISFGGHTPYRCSEDETVNQQL